MNLKSFEEVDKFLKGLKIKLKSFEEVDKFLKGLKIKPINLTIDDCRSDGKVFLRIDYLLPIIEEKSKK